MGPGDVASFNHSCEGALPCPRVFEVVTNSSSVLPTLRYFTPTQVREVVYPGDWAVFGPEAGDTQVDAEIVAGVESLTAATDRVRKVVKKVRKGVRKVIKLVG